MKKAILLIAALLIAAATAYADGSSMTFTPSQEGVGSNTFRLNISWVSDDSTGAVAGTTTSALNEWLAGKILIGADTRPSTTDAPDDNYDINIYELASSVSTTGLEVMGNTLMNRDTANCESVVPEVTTATAGTAHTIVAFKNKYYRISVTNAGNSKAGEINLNFRR